MNLDSIDPTSGHLSRTAQVRQAWFNGFDEGMKSGYDAAVTTALDYMGRSACDGQPVDLATLRDVLAEEKPQ